MTVFAESDHPRVTDGRFTDKPQSAPESSLAPSERFVAVKGSGPGQHRIESPQTHPGFVEHGATMRMVVHIGGDAHVNQRFGAAIRLVPDADRAAAHTEVVALAEAGKKMTVLIDGVNNVQAIEGTGGIYEGRPILFLKGSSKRFYHVDRMRMIGVSAGYGKQGELADRFNDVISQVPVTVPATFEGIPEYAMTEDDDDAPELTIAAAYLVDGPDFGNGREPGCMFLATDIQSDVGIVNGYFWTPDDAGLLTSESGSFYTNELPRKAGRIRDFEAGSMTYRHAWETLSDDRASGYREVVGK